MPAEVEPVDAPFTFTPPRRPTFPNLTISIVDCGAAPDSPQLCTAAIQSAIDQVAAAGGGTVAIPAGKWRTGRITLKSQVHLEIAEGATLDFSGRIEDYLPPVLTRYEGLEVLSPGGLVYGRGVEHVAITGQGELVGPESGPLREARPGLSDQLVDAKSAVETRIFDGQQGRHYFRPYFITLVGCNDVLLERVTLRHGPMWNIVPIECENVMIRGVTIDSRGVVNGDGIDVESSRNVLVEYCSVNTGDDCYVLKAGRDADGLRTGKPVENVVLRRNHAAGGIGGITCGSETAGTIRNVLVQDCVFDDVKHAVYLKTRRPRGGGVEKLWIDGLRFTANDHAVFCDMLGSPMFVGKLAERLPPRPLTAQTPFYRDVTLRRLVGRAKGDAIKIKGIPESPATRLTIEASEFESHGLVNLADVAGFDVARSRFRANVPTITLDGVSAATFAEVAIESSQPVSLELRGEMNRDALRWTDCSPATIEAR